MICLYKHMWVVLLNLASHPQLLLHCYQYIEINVNKRRNSLTTCFYLLIQITIIFSHHLELSVHFLFASLSKTWICIPNYSWHILSSKTQFIKIMWTFTYWNRCPKTVGTDHLFLLTYANHFIFLIFSIYLFIYSNRSQQQQRKSTPLFIYLCKSLVD